MTFSPAYYFGKMSYVSKFNSMIHVSILPLSGTHCHLWAWSLFHHHFFFTINFNCHSHACQCIPYLIIHYWSIIQSKRVNLWDRDNLRTKDKRLVPKMSFVWRLDCTWALNLNCIRMYMCTYITCPLARILLCTPRFQQVWLRAYRLIIHSSKSNESCRHKYASLICRRAWEWTIHMHVL